MNTQAPALRQDTHPPTTPKPPIQKGGALAALVPEDLDQAFRLAKALALSDDLVPRAFQGKPEATMAAITRGMEVGLPPMQALDSIAVINGRASLWGDALPALMQRAGHHVDVMIKGEGDGAVAIATLTRGDTGHVIERRFSMQDAKRAGLAAKPGPWQQYPTRMLGHRARAWAIRDGAADALMGLGIADEMSDAGPDRARDVTPRALRPGGVIYDDPEPAPRPAPEPDVIHEGEVLEDDDLAELADAIIARHADGDDPQDILNTWGPDLDRLEREAPDQHARVVEALS